MWLTSECAPLFVKTSSETTVPSTIVSFSSQPNETVSEMVTWPTPIHK